MDDDKGPDLSHPDSMIRLASTVLRFRCPEINKVKNLNFVRSFRTVGTHTTTQSVLKQADSSRSYLAKSLSVSGKDTPHRTIVGAAQKYLPFINQILLACKVQPENARLDQQLIFDWSSGIEKKRRSFRSEALMYELIMTIATEAMGTAGMACDSCTDGKFADACRDFKKAAGIMEFLETEQLPKWISKSSDIEDKDIPAEANVGTCEAFKTLFLAIAQQMAVATTLVKSATPNYSLVAKLSLGIAEQMETFVSVMRSKAPTAKTRIDEDFFVLMTFEIELQRAFSLYFQARNYWDNEKDYGMGIAVLSLAINSMKTRESPVSKGLPEIKKGSPLKSIEKDIADVKAHMNTLLKAWETDNSKVYFEKVPLVVTEDKKLQSGVHMMKPDKYELEEVEPIPLILPDDKREEADASQEATDHEMAMRLQEQLNAE